MEVYSDPDRPKNYSYRCVNNGIFDKYVLGRVCSFAIRLVPRQIAPNAVSILGSAFCWLAFLVLSGMIFGPLSSFGPRNPWVFGLLGVFIIAYQILDALDGIQARRLGCSGPLGEFIDHWCDSLNAFMIPLGIALAFPTIPPILAAFSVFLFALADWLCGRSALERGIVEFGPVSTEEGLCIIYFFFFSVMALGYDFWASPSKALGFPPVWLAFSIVPLAYAGAALAEFKRCTGVLSGLAIEIVTLLPIFAWIVLDLPRDGQAALLVGGLALGGAGTRFAGDVLRERLVGLKRVSYYVDYIIVGIALLASIALPGLPPWAPMAAALASLAWIVFTLASQFRKMITRVRAVLGTRIFG
jgi:phosphatidylglycerophosphate synthase